MRALTLWRPWPWALFFAPPDCLKDVENRPWGADWIVGEPVAIHAAHRVDGPHAFDFIERVCGVRPPEDGGATGFIGVVRFDAMLEQSTSPWFTGPIGWQIGWQQALSQPLEHPGNRRLWQVPPKVERQLRRRLAGWPPQWARAGGDAQ